MAKIWKQPKYLSGNESIKKLCIYTMEYRSTIRKNEICNNMDGPRWYYVK